MSNYKTHALNEFRAAGWTDENGVYSCKMQQAICEHVLALLDVFASEGHSGTSAPYAINLFSSLAKFEPVTKLTGEDWEWSEVSDGLWQNKRCGHVFKDDTDYAYDIDGKVFWNWSTLDDGVPFKSYYTSRDSRVQVTFPYSPKTVYEFSPTEEYPNEQIDQ